MLWSFERDLCTWYIRRTNQKIQGVQRLWFSISCSGLFQGASLLCWFSKTAESDAFLEINYSAMFHADEDYYTQNQYITLSLTGPGRDSVWLPCAVYGHTLFCFLLFLAFTCYGLLWSVRSRTETILLKSYRRGKVQMFHASLLFVWSWGWILRNAILYSCSARWQMDDNSFAYM